MMKLGVVLLLFGLPAGLLAQDSPRNYPSYGYIYSGGLSLGGNFGEFLNVGGGGEAVSASGLGLGGDVAYVFPREGFGTGVGLASANGSYHFVQLAESKKWVPFVTAGGSLAFRGGAAFLVNYGGGVTYWFRPRMGLRFEARNHYHSEISMFALRIGVSFR